jgi:hypothetical protein
MTKESPSEVQTQPPASALPDLNAGKYSFEQILRLLNRGVTDFSFFALPQSKAHNLSDTADPYQINGAFSLNINSTLHKFKAVVRQVTAEDGLKVAQYVGEAEGKFRCRLTIAPNDFPWTTNKEPSPILYDPLRAQRFAMLDAEFSFGDGKDSFSAYGVGRTFPVSVQGKNSVLVGGIGNIVRGRGKFEGLEGTLALNGTITHNFGFLGSITLRVVDWAQKLRTDAEIDLTSITDPDPEATYIVLRGQKKNQFVKSGYSFAPDGQLQGITAPAEWRAADYNFAAHGYRGLRSNISVGQIVGTLDATIITNILAPPGTADAPAPFSTNEVYTFVDSHGQTVGTINTGVVEGDSFNLTYPAAPGQPGLRFAGYGPITGGTGEFQGVQGMLTVNSLIGISPHVLSLIHVFRIIDPKRRYRAH